MKKKIFTVDLPEPSENPTKIDVTADDNDLEIIAKDSNNHAVLFPENPSTMRSFDFTPQYGQGFDPIVSVCENTIRHLAKESIKTQQQSLAISTITNYCYQGLNNFFQFLTELKAVLQRDLVVEDIAPNMMAQYIHHLKGLDLKSTSHRGYYNNTKSVLSAAITQGRLAHTDKDTLFPKNPFPNNNKKYQGESSLTSRAKRQVANALASEMKRIYSEEQPLTLYDLSVCVLSIGLSSGMNPTPVLTLPADCLQPHPLMDDKRLLVAYKRRGNATQVIALKKSEDVTLLRTVKMSVADTIDMIISRNQMPRSLYKDPSRLLVAFNQNHKVKPSVLSQDMLAKSTQKLIDRHSLTNDDGKPMRLNMSRLRKTFVNRIWELSGQDPLVAARVGKHSVSVANQHYWEAPENAEKDFKFMGEARVNDLLNSNIAYSPKANTPVAGCKDTIKGHLAPKDGSICTEILGCFRCKSFVVTEDDLYRLFSFYWAVVRERDTFGVKNWKKLLRHIIRIIDDNIAPQFDSEVITQARDKAQSTPHPYWKNLDMLRMAR